MSQTVAVILAAGMGTRMKSKEPKVLHKVAGVPMIIHVIDALHEASVEDIIIVLGYQGEKVKKIVGQDYKYVYQEQQQGTGHALLQALPALQELSGGNCLVLCGDTPLLRGKTLESLINRHNLSGAKATVLTTNISDPSGYGRIVKGLNGIEKIVEEKDASSEEKCINEINTGAYCFELKSLRKGLRKLTPANAQGEYYLTDIIKNLVDEKKLVDTLCIMDSEEAMGINNRVQLSQAETYLRDRILKDHMLNGVTIIDPKNTYVGKCVKIGVDTILYPGVILEGKTIIGDDNSIGPYTTVVDSVIDGNCTIKYSLLDKVKVGKNADIGPYSYLRPGTVLHEDVKVGDFSEVKNTQVGRGTKIPHLSYIGDSILGEGINIGAGTITCNYDGVNKHKTIIGDGVFVGSNTNLIAPIMVGEGAYIGAGSTVTKDVPSGALSVARGKQRNIENWEEHSRVKLKKDNNREGQ
ncbi:MAG: bifunctional UDP-N-acetylglucosamine diphosphorylase/glucosamine-1-phosphate N-acetyltransferase GlmU [Clostridia bacterium]|nr:bifunctional UDP-N-acetylglucosamine diphosphorylase/glucosamine-1-phosphate N-acetyltransferase GlmU [Clostridia bacterium]